MLNYIISIDQGTTSSRAVLFTEKGEFIAMRQREFNQIFPQKSWVEHDPMEIWTSQEAVLNEILELPVLKSGNVVAIGITNQRETSVVWDRETGVPVYNAIVWQDKRTAALCEELRAKGLSHYCKSTTGLVLDPYFSGTKVSWILENVEGARSRAERGGLCFGTIDSWLLWNLTKGEVHATDVSNASRTLMFDIRSQVWDEKMLDELNVPRSILPQVYESSHIFGSYSSKLHGHIPIAAVMGDQQSALFGQTCFAPGTAKNTYGTGCFMLMNTGLEIPDSPSGLLNTIAWKINGVTTYALEGSVFIAGSALKWLRDGIKILDNVADSSAISASTSDSGVIVVPTFSGIGTPHWDMHARGAIFGLTLDTDRPALIRATLESLAYQTQDVLYAMQNDSGISLFKLQVDGGASANDYLMQFQADLLGVEVERPFLIESTAAGVAFMAAITIGTLSMKEIVSIRVIEKLFSPSKSSEWRRSKSKLWNDALRRTLTD